MGYLTRVTAAGLMALAWAGVASAAPSPSGLSAAGNDMFARVCQPASPALQTALHRMQDQLIAPGQKIDMASIGASPTLQAARQDEA